MVAITGCGAARVELGRVGAVEPGEVPGGLDHHALQAEAQAERRDAARAGVPDRADLALDAAHAEAAGDQHAVHAGERGGRAGRGLGSRRTGPSGSPPCARWAKPPARSASVTDR